MVQTHRAMLEMTSVNLFAQPKLSNDFGRQFFSLHKNTHASKWLGTRAVVQFKYRGRSCLSCAPDKPKYKPRNIGKKIKSKLTDQTSITKCIEFYRLAFVPRGAGPLGPYGDDGTVRNKHHSCWVHWIRIYRTPLYRIIGYISDEIFGLHITRWNKFLV